MLLKDVKEHDTGLFWYWCSGEREFPHNHPCGMEELEAMQLGLERPLVHEVQANGQSGARSDIGVAPDHIQGSDKFPARPGTDDLGSSPQYFYAQGTQFDAVNPILMVHDPFGYQGTVYQHLGNGLIQMEPDIECRRVSVDAKLNIQMHWQLKRLTPSLPPTLMPKLN
jgi:hypothetical protein